MKKVITESVREEVKYYCDKHLDRECYSHLKTFSWYGSSHDMTGIEIHLCDECLTQMYKFIYDEFDEKPKEIMI